MKVSLLPGICTWLVVLLAGSWVQAQYVGLPPNGPMGDHPGRYAIAPASYEAACAVGCDDRGGCACGCGPGGGFDPCSCGPYGCGGCGRGGCGPGGCGPGGGGYGDCGDGDPYGDEGVRPRWFNVAFDFIYLTREEVSRTVNFTTADSLANDPFAPVVLSTNNLNFHEEPGFRATVQFIWGPAGDIEATYFGTLFYSTAARATGADNLYSAFSAFGTNPAGGFDDSDQAEVQSLQYESRCDSIELSYRERFISPNGRIQTSLLAGGRYVRLDDNFLFTSVVNRVDAGNPVTGNLSYQTATNNDLAGFQVGGDMSLSITRCITFGGELKAGLYNNHAVQKTNISATEPSAATYFETAKRDSAALVSEANVFVVVFLCEHMNVRAGYQLVYLDGVALGPENVNFTRAADGSFANRLASIDDTGNVFLHGLTFGAELTW